MHRPEKGHAPGRDHDHWGQRISGLRQSFRVQPPGQRDRNRLRGIPGVSQSAAAHDPERPAHRPRRRVHRDRLPSHRAGLVLKNELLQLQKARNAQAIWAPRVQTLTQLQDSLSPLYAEDELFTITKENASDQLIKASLISDLFYSIALGDVCKYIEGGVKTDIETSYTDGYESIFDLEDFVLVTNRSGFGSD